MYVPNTCTERGQSAALYIYRVPEKASAASPNIGPLTTLALLAQTKPTVAFLIICASDLFSSYIT